MDRLRMETKNKANENFKKLIEMFPNAVTESMDENGDIVRSIDKDILMQEINCKVVEGTEGQVCVRCGKNCCREQPHKRESEPEHGFGDKGNTIAVDVFKEAGVRWQSDRGDCKAESSQAGFSAYVRG